MKMIAPSLFVVLALAAGASAALADDVGQRPATAASDNPGDQFKAAGHNLGTAARQIGQGVKEGAVRTWDAVKAGASAASQKFQSNSAPTPSNDSDRDSVH